MKNATTKIDVQGTLVRVIKINGADYICITDIAALKNSVEPKDVVKNWMRSRATISFLGLWEKLYNPEFKGVDFDPLLKVAGDNAFTMSPTRWIETYNAKGTCPADASRQAQVKIPTLRTCMYSTGSDPLRSLRC